MEKKAAKNIDSVKVMVKYQDNLRKQLINLKSAPAEKLAQVQAEWHQAVIEGNKIEKEIAYIDKIITLEQRACLDEEATIKAQYHIKSLEEIQEECQGETLRDRLSRIRQDNK